MHQESKCKERSNKQLKVKPKYFTRTYGVVVFPELRFGGKWLQEAGFKSGDMVTVQVQNGKITIVVASRKQS